MIQAIQVLRFHLLELEKVSSKQKKTIKSWAWLIILNLNENRTRTQRNQVIVLVASAAQL